MGREHRDFFRKLNREGLEQVAKASGHGIVETAGFTGRVDLLQGADELWEASTYTNIGAKAFKRLTEELDDYSKGVSIMKKMPRGSRLTSLAIKVLSLAKTHKEGVDVVCLSNRRAVDRVWVENYKHLA